MVASLSIRGADFIDEQGRTVQLKGINVDGGSKYPKSPNMTSHIPADGPDALFFEGDSVSFVGRPFPLEDALGHLRRIKRLGYNVIRYLFTWEALEHEGPGKYDDEFVDYTIRLLKIIAQEGGLYVYLDPHQDVWNRFCGGDGAPMWTLYAAGLDPKCFEKTEAAVVQNFFPHDPDAYPKMLWTTNYHRLATSTMFTLFFAGRTFAPRCVLNGVNIQDYLQSHFINAVSYLLTHIRKQAPEVLETTLIGVETMNEPNAGFTGITDINELPESQNLKISTTPTVMQMLKLGMGIPTEVDEYKISVFGPKKTGSRFIDPEGVTAWLQPSESRDSHYGFERDPSWILGKCIWEWHGVWDSNEEKPLINDYFAVHPLSGATVDEEYFINNFFVDHFAQYREAVRAVMPNAFIFLEPPVLQLPPRLIGTDLIDDKTVYCPHYYDGMSLMFKSWNTKYNVDTHGIMRKKYSNPVFGIVFGEKNIRNSFRKQLATMKEEGEEYLGTIPVLFSEIGMPFDMDNKRAYDDDDFSSQTSALDALGYALEGSNLSHTWWCYASENCHKWGDRFNCEDFSFWSIDDDLDDSTLPGSRGWDSALTKRQYSQRSIGLDSSDTETVIESSSTSNRQRCKTYTPSRTTDEKAHLGLRAIDSIIRPYPLGINGDFIEAVFDLKNLTYRIKLAGSEDMSVPTKIFFPDWHFGVDSSVEISSGSYEFSDDGLVLEWLHEPGEQTLVVKAFGSQQQQQPTNFFTSFFSSICS